MKATMTEESSREKIARLQRERIERAVAEGEAYEFQPSPDGSYWSCFNPATGRYYTVTADACSCKDFEFVSGPKGLACKHLAARLLREEATR